MTRYRVILILLIFQICNALVYLTQVLFEGQLLMAAFLASAILILSGLLIAHLRGWRWSGEALVACVLILIILAVGVTPVDQIFFTAAFVPMVVAAVLLPPRWTLITFALTLLGIVVFVGVSTGRLSLAALGPTFTFVNLLVESTIALGVTVASA